MEDFEPTICKIEIVDDEIVDLTEEQKEEYKKKQKELIDNMSDYMKDHFKKEENNGNK